MVNDVKNQRGRPKGKDKKPRYNIMVRYFRDGIERLDAHQKRSGFISRSEFVRLLIDEALSTREKHQPVL